MDFLVDGQTKTFADLEQTILQGEALGFVESA
jgi:hypothetical protein